MVLITAPKIMNRFQSLTIEDRSKEDGNFKLDFLIGSNVEIKRYALTRCALALQTHV